MLNWFIILFCRLKKVSLKFKLKDKVFYMVYIIFLFLLGDNMKMCDEYLNGLIV